MRRYSVLLLVTLSLATSVAQANSRYQSMPQQGSNGGKHRCRGGYATRSMDTGRETSARLSPLLYF